jgi:hypothetical protein
VGTEDFGPSPTSPLIRGIKFEQKIMNKKKSIKRNTNYLAISMHERNLGKS